MEHGLTSIFQNHNVTATVVRQGSAFCVYFMDHAPVSWHDIAEHHDMSYDQHYRRGLIEQGIYHFPLPTKQGSISTAHTEKEIAITLERTHDTFEHLGLRT